MITEIGSNFISLTPAGRISGGIVELGQAGAKIAFKQGDEFVEGTFRVVQKGARRGFVEVLDESGNVIKEINPRTLARGAAGITDEVKLTLPDGADPALIAKAASAKQAATDFLATDMEKLLKQQSAEILTTAKANKLTPEQTTALQKAYGIDSKYIDPETGLFKNLDEFSDEEKAELLRKIYGDTDVEDLPPCT